jgi:hypothetical protein
VAKLALIKFAMENKMNNTFTVEDIRSWTPHFDPTLFLPENWSGSAIDLLKIERMPVQDRLWIVCRENLIPAETLRLFAVWCARQVEHLMTDERSKAALVVAEKFAHGEATEIELEAARNATWAAAGAAGVATRAAARNATWAAAGVATRDAAWAARDAARNAAGAAASVRDAQVTQLIKMLEE